MCHCTKIDKVQSVSNGFLSEVSRHRKESSAMTSMCQPVPLRTAKKHLMDSLVKRVSEFHYRHGVVFSMRDLVNVDALWLH